MVGPAGPVGIAHGVPVTSLGTAVQAGCAGGAPTLTRSRQHCGGADEHQGGAAAGDTAVRSGPVEALAPRVLVVDDNAGIRSLAGTILSAAGHAVTTAESADAAIALLEGGAGFDLVLSDVVMPGQCDGFALAQAVMVRCPGVPVILMSGYMPDACACWPSPTAFLRKPFHRGDLIDAVRTALALPRH
ncbi:response regulator [Elioraea rosea]|uniref:response regulator n=1 Tax=Elioraea rosea TaxID=2492390 RepID=UPI001184B5E5|nr:response regulator [Elioraea rosea]